MEGAHNFCSWCSPGPVVYADGSPGHRCADERDKPWDCPQHLQTKACKPLYTCNQTSGQCIHAKLGDPKATNQSAGAKVCMKKPKPNPHHQNKTTAKYNCNNQTGTCEEAHSAGGSPSTNGTSLATCNMTCHKAPKMLPLPLNGLYRGVMIQKGFKTDHGAFANVTMENYGKIFKSLQPKIDEFYWTPDSPSPAIMCSGTDGSNLPCAPCFAHAFSRALGRLSIGLREACAYRVVHTV